MSAPDKIIKAILYPNPMKNAKSKYLARTHKNTSYNIKDVCEHAKKNTGIVNADVIEYHVKIFFEQMLELVKQGNRVETGYFAAQAFVKGSFNTLHDEYDAQKHHVDIVYSASKHTRESAKVLSAKIVHGNPLYFGIQKLTDAQTKLIVTKLVANRLLEISGDKVKITGNDPSVGVYFVNAETGSELQLSTPQLYENGNATIRLFVPELAPGTYLIKIITQYSGNNIPLSQARSSIYPHLLFVD